MKIVPDRGVPIKEPTQPHRVRVKICGITTPEDAIAACRWGADAIGLNFFPRSPRHIGEEGARAILDVLGPFVEPVGLFVEASWHDVAAVMGRLGLRTCQVHASQGPPPADFPWRIIPAFPIRDATSFREIDACVKAWHPLAVLVDGHAAGLHGGTGQQAPWNLLASYRPAVPVILAGGLTPENVTEAIRIVQPDCVDVASGVELAPGKKDHDKMRRFMEAARGVFVS